MTKFSSLDLRHKINKNSLNLGKRAWALIAYSF